METKRNKKTQTSLNIYRFPDSIKDSKAEEMSSRTLVYGPPGAKRSSSILAFVR